MSLPPPNAAIWSCSWSWGYCWPCCSWWPDASIIYLVALILTTGLIATSLNLVLDFGGMYQFPHAMFYGLGAYPAALTLNKTDL